MPNLSLLHGPLRREMGVKQLEVLNKALPNARYVAVHEIEWVLAQIWTDLAVAEAIGLKAQLFEAGRLDEYEETLNEAIGHMQSAIDVPRFRLCVRSGLMLISRCELDRPVSQVGRGSG